MPALAMAAEGARGLATQTTLAAETRDQGGRTQASLSVAVVGEDLEEHIIVTVPLVEEFRDQILVPIQPKANWPLVSLVPGIAVYLYVHPVILAR